MSTTDGGGEGRRPMTRLERALREERLRREAARLGPLAMEQAVRMEALGRGEPDPLPDRDAEAADWLIEEFRKNGRL